MHISSLIALWRERAAEARAQAAQFQDGSISHTILLAIAESYLRLASDPRGALVAVIGSIRPPAHSG
jgi:hypothetical protein